MAVPFRPTLRPVLALIANDFGVSSVERYQALGVPRLERKFIAQKR